MHVPSLGSNVSREVHGIHDILFLPDVSISITKLILNSLKINYKNLKSSLMREFSYNYRIAIISNVDEYDINTGRMSRKIGL